MNQTHENIIISAVSKDNYDAWLPYWLSYQAFYKVALSETTTLETWQRFFDERTPVFCAVAKQNNQVVGFVHYLFHLSTWGITSYCYLEDLYVDEKKRGQHIGKQLINYVKKEAQQHQCARLYWHTQETNLTAQKLYDGVAEKPGVIEYRMPL